jgi:hypothetical protein
MISKQMPCLPQGFCFFTEDACPILSTGSEECCLNLVFGGF